ncbi:MAG: hypothetical protein ACTSR8_03000 [Promethearchaeota archaeon]
MGKNSAKLIDLLKASQYGLSINKIAEKIGWHRNTVVKYLGILEKEGKVFNREIGQYKLWLYQERENGDRGEQDQLLLKAYELFIKNLMKLHPDITDGKEIGKLISRELEFEKYSPFDFNGIVKQPLDLNLIAKTFMDGLNNIYFLTYERYKFLEPPIINEDPPYIILRIINSRYVQIPLHFEILTGLVEEKFNHLFPIKIDISINKIYSEHNAIDIKISF